MNGSPIHKPGPAVSTGLKGPFALADGGRRFGADQFEPGSVLANRYRISSLIGRGGMGLVYSAYDKERAEMVAVKTLSLAFLRQAEARQQFRQEAKISSNLNHPNIINVYDLGAEGACDFLTMELLEGRTLREEMAERKRESRPFALEEVRRVARQICAALAYAHRFTVHRDIKPENIWMSSDGTVKVMDFGLAKVFFDTGFSVLAGSRSGMSMGTPYYIAPEQLDGEAIDVRADQYSVAVLIYEMLTGQVLAGMAPPLRELRPDVPRSVSKALNRALAQRPDDRFPSMGDFARAIGGEGMLPVWWPKTSRGMAALCLGLACVGAGLWWGTSEVFERLESRRQESVERRENALESRDQVRRRLVAALDDLQALRNAMSARWPEVSGGMEYLTSARLNQSLQAAEQSLVDGQFDVSTALLQSLDDRVASLEERTAAGRAAFESAEEARGFREALGRWTEAGETVDGGLAVVDPGNLEIWETLWNEARQAFEERRFDDALRLFSDFNQQQRAFQSGSIEPLLADVNEAREQWEAMFPPGWTPRLDHLGGPFTLLETGEALFEEGKFAEAAGSFEEARRLFTSWRGEVDALHARTDRWLASLGIEQVRTNTLGMRFVPMGDVWIGAWEVRVMDFAVHELVVERADPGIANWNIVSDWKNVDIPQTPTSPVVNISYSDALQFVMVLMDLEWNHLGLLGSDAPSYHMLTENDLAELQSRLGGEELNLGLYSFGQTWPPPHGKGGYYSDPVLVPGRYVRPVGLGAPNPLGLFDFEGNAWEWTLQKVLGDRITAPDGEPYWSVMVGGGFFGEANAGGNQHRPEGHIFVGHPLAMGMRIVLWTGHLDRRFRRD